LGSKVTAEEKIFVVAQDERVWTPVGIDKSKSSSFGGRKGGIGHHGGKKREEGSLVREKKGRPKKGIFLRRAARMGRSFLQGGGGGEFRG